jgi:SAM-dependent methyltransferase
VLNAGSGERDVKLGERNLTIDIAAQKNPNVIGDLHCIPLLDDSVDTIVSIAVLEHTRFPWVVTREFHRVLRSGGCGIVAVPFLQPQHASPHDFVRFTEAGLVELMQYAGFDVLETAHVHHFGQTLAWLLWEYLRHNRPSVMTQPLWAVLLRQLSQGRIFKKDSPNTHNTHYVVVRKPGSSGGPTPHYLEALASTDVRHWFFPLLACPRTRQHLHTSGDFVVSEDGGFRYPVRNGVPDFVGVPNLATSGSSASRSGPLAFEPPSRTGIVSTNLSD